MSTEQRTRTDTPDATGEHSVAAVIEPLLHELLGATVPVRFEFWDGSAVGPLDGPGMVAVGSPDAVRRLLWSPGELGLGRAYVSGDLDVVGDVFGVLRALRSEQEGNKGGTGPGTAWTALRVARRLGALGGRPVRRPRRPGRAGGVTRKAATPRRSATTMTWATSSTGFSSDRA